ncbi:MAG: DHA2 family efflux MFS transporter permease subunit [Dehalococcoidia bacterium]|nr:DHA2 family efflux MFS transporter permease subunit [Dehalococcoidia bacterium]
MEGAIIEDKNHQTWIVISVAFASFMAALDTYIVNVALPAIAHHFNIGTSDAALVALAYLLIVTSALPIFGKIGDRIGFKKVFIMGFAFFIAGSLLCGLSSHIYILVGARCIQGAGASMLYAVGMAIIPRYIPQERRGWAFGMVATMAGLGVVIGAPLGGVITQYLSWNWIFLINVPVGIAAIIVAHKVIPECRIDKANRPRHSFDTVGALTSFIGLAALVSGLNKGQEAGWGHPGIIVAFLISAVLLSVFIVWEKHCKDPLLDLNIFNVSSFKYGAFAALFPWAAFAGGNFLLPFYLQLEKGLQPSIVGIVFLVSSIMYIITSPLMGKLSDRSGTRILCCCGVAGIVAASLFFIFSLSIDSLIPVMIYLAVMGFSMGTFVPANNNLTLGSVSEESQGASSAASRALINLGMVLGVAIYETIFNSVLPQSALNTSLITANIPHAVLNEGFRNAFWAGTILCGAGFILSLLARDDRKVRLKKGSPQI